MSRQKADRSKGDRAGEGREREFLENKVTDPKSGDAVKAADELQQLHHVRRGHATRYRHLTDNGRDPIKDWRMITLEAGVLRGDGTRFHDQEDRFVMIVERVLRRIKPAKEESQEGARAKEEEENDGRQPRSRGRRLVS